VFRKVYDGYRNDGNLRSTMTRRAISTIGFLTLIATLSLAQTAAQKPNTSAPTKVTGDAVKTASGLQYWDITVGTGVEAKQGSHVKVHYTGWLTSGKKFDSSVDAGQPFEFTIGRGDVIKGWEEGVAGMKVGGKRQLRIPPELGYGASGYPGVIPANATLIFDIQLLGVK
jgi:FKBP-type peptidyl-prolyl cis-trans isomerase